MTFEILKGQCERERTCLITVAFVSLLYVKLMLAFKQMVGGKASFLYFFRYYFGITFPI